MLNVNIGYMGHVDSGKTSLARALSSTASTAAFDKSPQSKERGITLDLGFSSRVLEKSDIWCAAYLEKWGLQRITCTFVDCPGHASLIRTIVGGAQIIDVIILVIDATKGIQPQTAECMVIGEVLAKPLVIAINKVDKIKGKTPEETEASLRKIREKLRAALLKTRWPVVEMVEVAAAPGYGGEPEGLQAVLPAVLRAIPVEQIKSRWEPTTLTLSDFIMLCDHCFAVKGHGTVFTGTVLRGKVEVGDTLYLPEHDVEKKVKSLQVFKKNVTQAKAGDRVGLCVAQFDATNMERGMLCGNPAAGGGRNLVDGVSRYPSYTRCFIAEVYRVRFHHLPCDMTTKYHLTLGHTTVMATLRYFSQPSYCSDELLFDPTIEGRAEAVLPDEATLRFERVSRSSPAIQDDAPNPQIPPAGLPIGIRKPSRKYLAVVQLENPILCFCNSNFVAMRLDVEKENMCRIAMTGTICYLYGEERGQTTNSSHRTEELWRALPVYRYKRRELVVDRVLDPRTCIASGLVVHQTNNGNEKTSGEMHAEAQKFVGFPVYFVRCCDLTDEDQPLRKEIAVKGSVDSTFGKSGKVKLSFSQRIFADSDVQKKSAPRAAERDRTTDEQAPTTTWREEGTIFFELKKSAFAMHSQMETMKDR